MIFQLGLAFKGTAMEVFFLYLQIEKRKTVFHRDTKTQIQHDMDFRGLCLSEKLMATLAKPCKLHET